jgi:hypothetical protein
LFVVCSFGIIQVTRISAAPASASGSLTTAALTNHDNDQLAPLFFFIFFLQLLLTSDEWDDMFLRSTPLTP